MNGAGTWTNESGGTFTASITTGTFNPPFINQSGATFNRTGTGLETHNGTFINAGTVNITAGTLQLGGTSSSSGSYHISSGAVLETPGAHTFDSTSVIDGAGNVNLNSGNAVLTGSYAITGTTTLSGTASFNMDSVSFSALVLGGTLQGSATKSVPSGGTFTWNSGTLAGTGTVTIESGATATFATTSARAVKHNARA